MKRRSYIKTVTLGSVIPLALSGYGMPRFGNPKNTTTAKMNFKSEWNQWPDMKWAGPEYWGNRLQDWDITQGKLRCNLTAEGRNLHLLTVQNTKGDTALSTSVTIEIRNPELAKAASGCVGMVLGAKGEFDDYRSASVFGKGINIGLTPSGKLQVGEQLIETGLESLPENFTLTVNTSSGPGGKQNMVIDILDPRNQTSLFRSKDIGISKEDLIGNFALLADVKRTDAMQNGPSCSFDDWAITSEALHQNEEQVFGPVCFAQYSLHNDKLKLKGQFMPFEELPGHTIKVEFKKDGNWMEAKELTLKHPGRCELFTVENWEGDEDVPYRITAELPRKDGILKYHYEGTVAKEPTDKDDVKLAVLNCNADYGFPDSDIHESLAKLDYDLSAFLGDQFYEATGGFGAQFTGDFDKRCLDFLRKWMLFGWSYREVFRHKPCAVITDDHDVYHGNLWGVGGGHADTSLGYGSDAQDTGGYKMDADWVNALQFVQTGHLPDPYDPTPVKQNINVYYCQWNYGGVSFAILEDRKFKSAPKMILPPEAEVFNGFIIGKDFDLHNYRDDNAELLGKRQESFLENWASDWPEDVQMKAVISQTNFAAVATLPKDDNTGSTMVHTLPVPEKGEYLQNEAMTPDADCNAWPQNKRDDALRIIRKAMSFHVAGDQHLGTFVQYGVDDFGDSGYCFTGPALNNVWPRRFYPPVDASGHTYENPAYTGDHLDGFGNKITVKAVSNPYKSHKLPERLHDRSTGYSIVTFHKKDRTITADCYKRFHDPLGAEAQYPGWPITISQEDNYLSKAAFFLPELQITSERLPVLRVFEEDGTLLYVTRVPSLNYRPKVFAKGNYRIALEIGGKSAVAKEFEVKAAARQGKRLKIDLTA